jgi:hypothetical protein
MAIPYLILADAYDSTVEPSHRGVEGNHRRPGRHEAAARYVNDGARAASTESLCFITNLSKVS